MAFFVSRFYILFYVCFLVFISFDPLFLFRLEPYFGFLLTVVGYLLLDDCLYVGECRYFSLVFSLSVLFILPFYLFLYFNVLARIVFSGRRYSFDERSLGVAIYDRIYGDYGVSVFSFFRRSEINNIGRDFDSSSRTLLSILRVFATRVTVWMSYIFDFF